MPVEARWERTARASRWGQYISSIERTALRRGMDITTGPRVALDVGSEAGRWAELLADDGWAVTCTEIDRSTLDLCQQRVPTARCMHVAPDSRALPAEEASLGLVLCFEVFAVVHEPWFVNEVARVLAPGGVLVAVTHNRASYRRLLWAVNRRRTGADDRPMYARSYQSWRRELIDLGLTPRHEEGLCWMPFSRASNSPFVGPCTKLEELLGLRHHPTFSPWVCTVMQHTRFDHTQTCLASQANWPRVSQGAVSTRLPTATRPPIPSRLSGPKRALHL